MSEPMKWKVIYQHAVDCGEENCLSHRERSEIVEGDIGFADGVFVLYQDGDLMRVWRSDLVAECQRVEP